MRGVSCAKDVGTMKDGDSKDRPASILLNQRVRIQVQDGRVLVGDFVCLDTQGNIVLYNAVERLKREGKIEEKILGQVLVPKFQRTSCHVEVCGQQEKMRVEEAVRMMSHHPDDSS